MIKNLLFLATLSLACGSQSTIESKPVFASNKKSSVLTQQTGAKEIPIDLDKSVIAWKGTKITGKHEGTVNFREGQLTFSEGKLIGGELIVDMESIDISDIPEHETTARRNLLNHFIEEFTINQFSKSSFTFTEVNHSRADRIEIAGQLSIRGVSNPIRIFANKTSDGYTSEFSFNRFDWGIGENGSWFEKRLVDEMIQLKVKLVPKSNPALTNQ
ncbi:Polyisoprenoid-binding protein YceI [Ekhidna lutea]|uniref:Polyisoprenoid-binding protein YceI n=1 Tax=Ekhidna lutea TaxID=447679 RepID=A0A239MBX5_EKHLU|nr:YceI family protein [Ekhidna lutea]SNT39672.1 Polyisoprenoid-binding protein YceI [Ekhidna lutea]